MEILDFSSQLNPKMEISVTRVGKYHRPIIIIDNIFKDPLKVREVALQQEYTKKCSVYPGSRSVAKIDTKPFVDLLRPLLTYTPAEAASYAEFAFYDSKTHDPHLHLPHCDGLFGTAVICHLALPEFCSGGTGIYRHKKTGIYYFGKESLDDIRAIVNRYEIPISNHQVLIGHMTNGRLGNCNIAETMELDFTDAENPNPYAEFIDAKYELLALPEVKFNRLVSYDSGIIHGPRMAKNYVNDSMNSTRLTMRMFFAPSEKVEQGFPSHWSYLQPAATDAAVVGASSIQESVSNENSCAQL